MNSDANIVLIGMPGSGKSTVGVILAKMISYGFIDTDLLIQSREGRTLQAIVDTDGHLALRRIEERVICDLDCRRHVIATGGSVVYSPPAMAHLSTGGVVVFLDVDLATLAARIDNFETRGLARRPDQSLADLFAERSALYARYADLTVDGAKGTHEAVCRRLMKVVEKRKR